MSADLNNESRESHAAENLSYARAGFSPQVRRKRGVACVVGTELAQALADCAKGTHDARVFLFVNRVQQRFRGAVHTQHITRVAVWLSLPSTPRPV